MASLGHFLLAAKQVPRQVWMWLMCPETPRQPKVINCRNSWYLSVRINSDIKKKHTLSGHTESIAWPTYSAITSAGQTLCRPSLSLTSSTSITLLRGTPRMLQLWYSSSFLILPWFNESPRGLHKNKQSWSCRHKNRNDKKGELPELRQSIWTRFLQRIRFWMVGEKNIDSSSGCAVTIRIDMLGIYAF
jgi:hypothetical protein